MEGSDVTNYIRPLYNINNNFNKFSREDSDVEKYNTLLSPLKKLIKLLLNNKTVVYNWR